MKDKSGAKGSVEFGMMIPNSTLPFDIILYQIQRRPSAVFDHGRDQTRHCLIDMSHECANKSIVAPLPLVSNMLEQKKKIITSTEHHTHHLCF